MYNCSNLGCDGNFVCKEVDGYLTCACPVGFTGDNCDQHQGLYTVSNMFFIHKP